jgi:hypothetical protein
MMKVDLREIEEACKELYPRAQDSAPGHQNRV